MIGRFSELGVYRELLRSRDFFRIAAAALFALGSYMLSGAEGGVHRDASVALAAVSLGLNGVPIVWAAGRGVLQRRVNVDELVSLAIIGSVAQGELLTAAVVSFVMVFGSLVEQATSNSARRAIRTLVNLTPETASVLREGRWQDLAIEQVEVGDRVLIRPGERVPVDGAVTKGVTWVDESSMTGEPMPVEKSAGSHVFAGTLNHGGTIEVATTKVGANTTLGKVVQLVSQAEAHRPQTVRVIDRYARWFTPTILLAAGLAWTLSGQVERAIAVLIVGCPCALILAAPTAVVATIGRAARAGVLVKGGVHLETVGRVDAILFDKTGTLTSGQPCVDEIVAAGGVQPKQLLERAASAEQHSSHPLARAVLSAARDADVCPSEAEEMTAAVGLGVRAVVGGRLVEVGSSEYDGGRPLPGDLHANVARFKERGATPLVVFDDGMPVGVIGVTDRVRPGAGETVRRLRAQGVRRISVVSGDHEQAARRVADAVGADSWWARVAPDDKPRIVQELQRQGMRVMFVGDGINDAPALATADVGVAMGAAGTDVALETADIALMRDDLSALPFLFRLGRRMLRVIKWNIAFGLCFNAAAVAASGSGYLTPIAGAIVHNIGSVLVVVSSSTMAFLKQR